MGANSKIEWTDHTFNTHIGCAKVHEGCAHCYAEAFSKRTGNVKWGPEGTRVKTSAAYWRQPLKWNRLAEAAGERRRVFCASLADVFEDYRLPILDHYGRQVFLEGKTYDARNLYGLGIDGGRQATLDDLRRDLFALIDATPWLDWLLLTKRPENVRRMWDYSRKLKNGRVSQNEGDNIDVFRPNVWLGTSVSDQETTDRMVPELLRCRDLVPVLFVSAEPPAITQSKPRCWHGPWLPSCR
jgi:protein gp37